MVSVMNLIDKSRDNLRFLIFFNLHYKKCIEKKESFCFFFLDLRDIFIKIVRITFSTHEILMTHLKRIKEVVTLQ